MGVSLSCGSVHFHNDMAFEISHDHLSNAIRTNHVTGSPRTQTYALPRMSKASKTFVCNDSGDQKFGQQARTRSHLTVFKSCPRKRLGLEHLDWNT